MKKKQVKKAKDDFFSMITKPEVDKLNQERFEDLMEAFKVTLVCLEHVVHMTPSKDALWLAFNGAKSKAKKLGVSEEQFEQILGKLHPALESAHKANPLLKMF